MKSLLLILGATGVGKTELSLRVAEHYGCPILNCDSRQVFRGIPVGTAAPTAEEQARVKHYFIATRELEDDYNAGQYERDALALMDQLFAQYDVLVMTGGSMLYADAVCNGLDDLPSVPASIRERVRKTYEANGLEWLQSEVQRLDPEYWNTVDRSNPARLAHCIELCLTTGKAYSSLLSRKSASPSGDSKTPIQTRPFRIVKIGLRRERENLFQRINQRVDLMMQQGLMDEAQRLYPLRHLNSLNTVGYKELFKVIEGEWELPMAVERIKKNTRVYAKKQMTWFAHDAEIHWIDVDKWPVEQQIQQICDLLESKAEE